MSSLSSLSVAPARFSVADLTPLAIPANALKFDDTLDSIQLPVERSPQEIAAQIERQNQTKLLAVFQSNGKIIGNVLENGWSRMESNADGRSAGAIWDEISQFGLSGRDAAEYLTQRLADQLRQRYPDLEVVSFDAAQAPTSGDYQQQVAAGGMFSPRTFYGNDGQSLQAQASYDLFSALFLRDNHA